jgi:2-oxoglutarate ferredoxin oxidoreductase subunit beta
MSSLQDLNTTSFGRKPDWCPGCGNFGILMALKQAVSELQLDPKNTVLVSGIGCGPKMPLWINVSGFQSLHGRTLPVASGIKLANHKLDVFATSGDGDAYGIGTCHFIHAMRRNIDMVYIVHDNQVYGLTQGQASPTTDKGTHTKSTPFGVIEVATRPLSLAIVSGASFVARGFAGDIPHLKSLIVEAHKHRGFALIDVLQPCVTFNKTNTYQWFQERVYKLGEDYDPTDKMNAIKTAQMWGDKIPLGIYYRENRPTYNDELPQIADKTLREYGVDNIDISELMREYS